MKYYQNIFDIQMYLLENEFDINYDTIFHDETYENGRLSFSLSEDYNFLIYCSLKNDDYNGVEVQNPSVDDVKKILRLDKLKVIRENTKKKQERPTIVKNVEQVHVKSLTFIESFYKKMFK